MKKCICSVILGTFDKLIISKIFTL